MSKSSDNAIFLSDSETAIRNKVKMMYTDPNHLHTHDPGIVEGNPVFAYLDAFDPDAAEVAKLKDNYRRGGLGDTIVKQRLIEVLLSMLNPIRSVREEFAKDPEQVMQILLEGTNAARQAAAQTLSEVRRAMCIDYQHVQSVEYYPSDCANRTAIAQVTVR